MDSSLHTRVAPSPVASSRWRWTALNPEDTPVQVTSRPGSTTANLDFMWDRPLTQVKRVSTATGASRWTSWTSGAKLGQAMGSASSSHTRCTGASISTW